MAESEVRCRCKGHPHTRPRRRQRWLHLEQSVASVVAVVVAGVLGDRSTPTTPIMSGTRCTTVDGSGGGGEPSSDNGKLSITRRF